MSTKADLTLKIEDAVKALQRLVEDEQKYTREQILEIVGDVAYDLDPPDF